MADEGQHIEVGETFLRAKVIQELNNAGLTAWKVEPEPYAGALPVVTFVYIGGVDEEPGDSGDIIMHRGLWRVLARANGATIGVTRLAARAVHKALHRTSGANAYGTVLWSRRERPYRETFVGAGETENRQPEVLHGGDYRITVQAE